jgi:ATP-dependent DNA helicase RecG
LIKKSEEYLVEKMNWKVGFGRMERKEIPEVPLAALREALINSICHRDYATPESNYIAVYKDRIEIDNPGSFPEGMDPEDFIFKDEQSVLRNPLIADILYRTKDIEKWGSGLKRIFEECRDSGVKVEFKKLKTGFRVVFYRREEFVTPDSSEPVRNKFGISSDKVRIKFGESAGKLVEMIAENPGITSDLMALKLDMTRRGIEKIIAKLKEEGIIKRSGSRKTGYWEIIEKE